MIRNQPNYRFKTISYVDIVTGTCFYVGSAEACGQFAAFLLGDLAILLLVRFSRYNDDILAGRLVLEKAQYLVKLFRDKVEAVAIVYAETNETTVDRLDLQFYQSGVTQQVFAIVIYQVYMISMLLAARVKGKSARELHKEVARGFRHQTPVRKLIVRQVIAQGRLSHTSRTKYAYAEGIRRVICHGEWRRD